MTTNTGGDARRRPGFRGVRNTDTTAATRRSIQVRQAKALERKIQAAEALLIEHGYQVIHPTRA